MTTSWPTSHTRHVRRGPAFLTLAVLLAAALLAPGATATRSAPEPPARTSSRPAAKLHPLDPYTYTWPLKPFRRQHPVRAFFGDPRIGPTPAGLAHNFHFGIDIHGDNGQAVYATLTGYAVVEARRPEVVAIVGDDGRSVFEYWHVASHVHSGQRVIAKQTVVGHIARWQHVHFAELRYGRYVNPLRPGGLGPYRDRTRPYVKEFRVQRGNRIIEPDRVAGRVDLVVEAYDPAPTPLPEPWTGNSLTPARVSWRLVGARGTVSAWHTAVDFTWGIPANGAYSIVYAHWTRQNKRAHIGRYRFVLLHDFDTRAIADGSYEIEVAAADTKGNTGTARFAITIRNL
jgi:hypothetical protein